MNTSNDPLWPHFVPLWNELHELGAGEILIAGGYGLFLKQQWLRERPDQAIVIPLGQWLDGVPRVTDDFDFVLDLDLIADGERNRSVFEILQRNGFAVTEKRIGKRWRFEKPVSDRQLVIAELHAPTPKTNAQNLRTEKIRIKHKPSLGDQGIHGRHNPEALGSGMRAFRFESVEVDLAVPNP